MSVELAVAPPVAAPAPAPVVPAAPPAAAPAPAPIAQVPDELAGLERPQVASERLTPEQASAKRLAERIAALSKPPEPPAPPPAPPASAVTTLPPVQPPVPVPAVPPVVTSTDPFHAIREQAAQLITSPDPTVRARAIQTLQSLEAQNPQATPAAPAPPVDPAPQAPDWNAERAALAAQIAADYRAKNTVMVREIDANGNTVYTPTWKPGTNPEEVSFVQDHLELKTELAFRDRQAAFQNELTKYQQTAAEKQAQAQRAAAEKAATESRMAAVTARVTDALAPGTTLDFDGGVSVPVVDMVPTGPDGKPTAAAVHTIRESIFRLNEEIATNPAHPARLKLLAKGIDYSAPIPRGPQQEAVMNHLMGMALAEFYHEYGGKFIAQARAAARAAAPPPAPVAPTAPVAAPVAPPPGLPIDSSVPNAVPIPASVLQNAPPALPPEMAIPVRGNRSDDAAARIVARMQQAALRNPNNGWQSPPKV